MKKRDSSSSLLLQQPQVAAALLNDARRRRAFFPNCHRRSRSARSARGRRHELKVHGDAEEARAGEVARRQLHVVLALFVFFVCLWVCVVVCVCVFRWYVWRLLQAQR